jgi:hypothetical protein
MKVIKYFLSFFLGVLQLSAFSQDIAFTATASKTNSFVGDQIQVSYTLNSNGNRFQAPALNDFNVLMGPAQSTSMQFVNGNMSQSLSFTYYLQPKSEGTFKLGPASIEAGGKRIQSNVITIVVGKAAGANQGAQKNAAQAQSGAGAAAAADDGLSKQITDNLFLRVSLDKTNVYQGEGILATYKVYTRLEILNFAMSAPALNGFWSQDLESPKNFEMHKETLDGVQYQVYDIKKTVLFPQHAGMLTLEPMTAEFIARVQVKRKRGRDPFDIFNDPFFNDPFFGSGYQDVKQKIKSNTLKINVKALPDPAPEGYGGAVGKFSMEAVLDKSQTKTNEPVSLKIKVSGKGNLKLFSPPKLNFPNDIESFDPKSNDNITISANGVSGSKTVEYLLIPRRSGEYKIEPVVFWYFDLDKHAYVSIASPEFKIKVAKGNESEGSNTASGVDKEDIQLLGRDIRYIKTGMLNFSKKGDYLYGSPLFISLAAAPFLLLLALLAYRRKLEAMNSNISLVKSRKATSVAKKRLSTANKFLLEKNKSKFYEEVSRALWGYLSDKFSIPLAMLSKENVIEKLQKRMVSQETILALTDTIEHCDFARFAPPSGSEEMQKTYKATVGLIAQLEQEIKA